MMNIKKQDTRLDKFMYLHTQKCIELLIYSIIYEKIIRRYINLSSLVSCFL